MPLSLSKLKKVGKVELVKGDVEIDDFALDGEKRVAYLASGEVNSVLKLGLDTGKLEAVIGSVGDLTVAGVTSARLGDGGRLFISTNGGIVGPVNGTLTEGGKVIEIELAF